MSKRILSSISILRMYMPFEENNLCVVDILRNLFSTVHSHIMLWLIIEIFMEVVIGRQSPQKSLSMNEKLAASQNVILTCK